MNSRYGGQHGWKLSSRFETALRQLADKCAGFRDRKTSSKEKDTMLVQLMDARRSAVSHQQFDEMGGETH